MKGWGATGLGKMSHLNCAGWNGNWVCQEQCMKRAIVLFCGLICLAAAPRCAQAGVLYQNDFTGNAIDPS